METTHQEGYRTGYQTLLQIVPTNQEKQRGSQWGGCDYPHG